MKDEFKRARQTWHWMGRKKQGKTIGNRMARRQVQRDNTTRIVLAEQEILEDQDWEEWKYWQELDLDDEWEKELWNRPWLEEMVQ